MLTRLISSSGCKGIGSMEWGCKGIAYVSGGARV